MSKTLVKEDKNGWPGRMFSFWPPVFFGLQDAINPCGLASLIIFISFLSVVAKTRKRLIWCGLIVILAAGMAKAVFVLGEFDALLQQTFVFDMIRGLYLVLSFVFIFCGIVHFKDWTGYKRDQKKEAFIFKVPTYFKEDFSAIVKVPAKKIKIIFLTLGLFLLSVIIGFFMAVMESLLGHDYALFVDFFRQGHTAISLIFSLILFSVSSWFLMVGFWILLIWFFSSQKFRKSIIESVSFIKILSSAIYLSSGLGLLYVFFK